MESKYIVWFVLTVRKLPHSVIVSASSIDLTDLLIINQCTLCFCDAQSLSPDKYYGIIGIHYRDGGTSEQNARKVLVTQYTG